MFKSAISFIAWRYIKGSKKQRFASFVAFLATLGIAIGVCALIVVSSIMQGLQERLKASILNDCAHVVVTASEDDIPYLLSLPYVNALVPFVQGEAMLQYGSDIVMVTLQGTDYSSLFVNHSYAATIGLTTIDRQAFVSDADRLKAMRKAGASQEALERFQNSANLAISDEELEQMQLESLDAMSGGEGSQKVAETAQQAELDQAARDLQQILFCIPMPRMDRAGYHYGSIFNFPQGSYALALNYQLMVQLGLDVMKPQKVRLISTQNARYTPFGLTPVQRNFEVTDMINAIDKSAAPTVIGQYSDVRRFLRLSNDQTFYRLYLSDPFLVEEVASELDGKFAYTDWRERYGDFFKAVGLEKITMSVLLCLIVVVAAFNILSSLTMVVSSRVGEIAILKTIGMTNGSLLTIFLLVGMSSSIVGALLGVVLGIPLALNAQSILNGIGISIVQGELPIEIATSNIVMIVALCLVVSLLCTFYPAYYASKADPVTNLVNS